MADSFRQEAMELILEKYKFNGEWQSPIPCLKFFTTTTPMELTSIMYEPCLCIILQGTKAVGFGKVMFQYSPYEYLLASAHIPATVQVLEASQLAPYVSMTITFTLEEVYEVLKSVPSEKLKFQKKSEKGLFFGVLEEGLCDSLKRLVRLSVLAEEDRRFLTPLVIKEILYWLVNTKSGYFLNKFAMKGTVSNKIVKAITHIKENFNEKVSVKSIANLVQMSESSLYHNFKIITSLSPLQFQKKLRLEEARKILTIQNIEISEVAFLVGYESPSQFSREYSRMFGSPPTEYLKTIKSVHPF